MYLAEAIAALFPKLGQACRWYSRSVSENGKTADARGALANQYSQCRQRAIALNFIESKQKNITTKGIVIFLFFIF